MNRLIYAASEQNADLFYATGFLTPDAYLFFEKGTRRHIAVSSLEYDRARQEARVHEVINQTAVAETLRRKHKKPIVPADWMVAILRDYGVRRAQVAPSFPVGIADLLRKRGIRLQVVEGGLFPERAIKKPAEITAIEHILRMTAELMEYTVGVIRHAQVRVDGVLLLNGKPLTSERLQLMVRTEAACRGCDASHVIIAGGQQGCDPHQRGHGPLRARELIILDFSPRDALTGFYGDLTRTVIKGAANEDQRRQFDAVRRAQRLAISHVRAGADGKVIHGTVDRLFTELGYPTRQVHGHYEGFFHGTGHGIGLEIHEAPRVSLVTQKLRAGHVITIEPGLYYPAVGGVRIEDVVLVLPGGCRLLSHFPVQLEIG
jgi:Xaa-Pro aminopeptidase